jgi:hypothetical protein
VAEDAGLRVGPVRRPPGVHTCLAPGATPVQAPRLRVVVAQGLILPALGAPLGWRSRPGRGDFTPDRRPSLREPTAFIAWRPGAPLGAGGPGARTCLAPARASVRAASGIPVEIIQGLDLAALVAPRGRRAGRLGHMAPPCQASGPGRRRNRWSGPLRFPSAYLQAMSQTG